MTIYVDGGKVCHIYSSEHNLTLQIALPTNDYKEHNGSELRVGRQKEASKLLKAEYVFMADVWKPKTLNLSGHLWIPIKFNSGIPVLSR